MAPFFPLYIRRSDGRIEIKAARGAKSELNEPMPEQLDSKPNEQGVSDFYRQCLSGDVKEIDWRRKLAGMLMREIGTKDTSNRNYILASLPENYRLYEHVKCKASDADGAPAERPHKTHAAGGNERQDAYLYGHPQGRKKRYRSPAEFFPHLLWLATDEAGDPNNCSCKFCSPEELDGEDKSKAIAKDSKAQVLKPAAGQSTSQNDTSTGTVGVAGLQRSSSNGGQSSIEPTPLPSARSQEQLEDSKYGFWLYRIGEVIWFARGNAWGLGVIASRESNNPPQKQYSVQPLSHPFDNQRPLLCSQGDLRPWLAWSPPPCTCKDLEPSAENGNRISMFDTVDWNSILQGVNGAVNAEIDASILAVKAVELTYTPIDPAPERSNSSESHYNGIYFGGEKIWIGEPLRLRVGSATDLMVLHDIVEKTNHREPSKPILTFVGDIFSWRVKGQEAVPAYSNLMPERVKFDLGYRNNVSMDNPNPTAKFSSYWKLTKKMTALYPSDVKGRWYESSLVSNILDHAAFNEALHNYNVPDTTTFMNGQGDCNRQMDPQHGYMPVRQRKATREEAFSRSVPPDFKIAGGLTSAYLPQQTQNHSGYPPQIEAQGSQSGYSAFMGNSQLSSQGHLQDAFAPHVYQNSNQQL